MPPGIGRGRRAITSTDSVTAADQGITTDATSGTFSQNLTSAATLGSGFTYASYNSGSGVVTIDPAGTETIRSPAGTATTLALAQGQGVVLQSDGTNWDVIAAAGIASAPSTPLTVRDNAFTITGNGDTTKLLVTQVDTQATGLTTTLDVGAQTGSYSATLPVMPSSSIFAMSAAALTSGRIPFATTNGLLLDSASLAWNNGANSLAVGGIIAVTQGTITSAATAIGATSTWNNGAVTFDGLNFIATLTANSADSRLLNLQTGAGRIYSVIADGSQVFSGAASAQPSVTYDTSCIIQRTGNAGSAPYDQAGSIVIRPQVSGVAGRSSVYIFTGSASTQALRVNEAQNVLIGTNAAVNTSERLAVIGSTATTNAVVPGIVWGANSTGTAAAGFGISELVTLESSTTNNTSVAEWDYLWSTATHASRKGQILGKIYDTSARTWVQVDTDGTNSTTKFPDTLNATSATAANVINSGGQYIAKNILSAMGQGWGVASTVTAAGTTTLTATSAVVQTFTGTTTQTVQFPAANLFGSGIAVVFVINNQSTGTVTPTRAGSDTFQGGGTTDPVLAGASQTYMSNGSAIWLKV